MSERLTDDELDEVRASSEYAEPLIAELSALRAERDKLQRFKDWCHGYLDTHGVPHHPPGPHGAEGCRIGDRMDWLMTERDALRAEVERLRSHIQLHVALAPAKGAD